MKELPLDFWNTGPLCQAHGGSASIFECKACKLALPLRGAKPDSILITTVWVPFESRNPTMSGKRKANDLPRFSSPEEVKDFIQYNTEALVHRFLNWEEYSEAWAIEEFAKGVGRTDQWKYGLPLAPDADPINPDLYRQVKKLSS